MNENRVYEGMFLLDAGKAQFDEASEPIRSIMERNDAEILAIKPWDERRLTYEISGRKRGLYILTYFKVDPSRLPEIEHDCRLNEDILRLLIVKQEGISDERIAADTPATAIARSIAERVAKEEAAAQAAAEAAPAEDAAAEAKAADEQPQQDVATAESAPAEDAAAPETPAEMPAETPAEAPSEQEAPSEAAEKPADDKQAPTEQA